MSKVKVLKKKKAATRKEWPSVVYLWSIGLAFLGYLILEIGYRDTTPHPVHWLGGLIGGLVGIGAGWLWYYWRGDVF